MNDEDLCLNEREEIIKSIRRWMVGRMISEENPH